MLAVLSPESLFSCAPLPPGSPHGWGAAGALRTSVRSCRCLLLRRAVFATVPVCVGPAGVLPPGPGLPCPVRQSGGCLLSASPAPVKFRARDSGSPLPMSPSTWPGRSSYLPSATPRLRLCPTAAPHAGPLLGGAGWDNAALLLGLLGRRHPPLQDRDSPARPGLGLRCPGEVWEAS